MPNDLDILMAHVAEINVKLPLTYTTQDLDILIAYHRHNRARRATGFKPTKPVKPTIDVLSLLSIKPTPRALTTTPTTGKVRRL